MNREPDGTTRAHERTLPPEDILAKTLTPYLQQGPGVYEIGPYTFKISLNTAARARYEAMLEEGVERAAIVHADRGYPGQAEGPGFDDLDLVGAPEIRYAARERVRRSDVWHDFFTVECPELFGEVLQLQIEAIRYLGKITQILAPQFMYQRGIDMQGLPALQTRLVEELLASLRTRLAIIQPQD